MSRDLCGSIVADSWLMPILRMPPFFAGLADGAGVGAAWLAGAAAAAVTTGFGASVGLAATAGAWVAGAAAGAAGFGASVGLAAGAAVWAAQAVRSPAPMPAPSVDKIKKRRRERPRG